MNDSEWSNWNWLNVAFVFINGYFALEMFEDEKELAGWANVLASSVNMACVAARLF